MNHRSTRIILFHWLAVPLAILSLLSGLRLYASNRLASEPSWASWLPTGDVFALHLTLGAAWGLLALVYIAHFVLRDKSSEPPAEGTRASKWLNTGLRWLTLLILTSGGLLYLGAWQIDTLSSIHLYLALLLPMIVLAHVVAEIMRKHGGSAVKSVLTFRVSPRALIQPLIILLLVLGLIGWWVREQADTATELHAHAIGVDEEIRLDGRADEPVWQSAPSVTVLTQGVGAEGRIVPVTIKSLLQGDVIYFSFSWPDDTPSMEHMSLLKTEQGWVVRQEGLIKHDETRYYEDKLAVMFAEGGHAAGHGSVQLGAHALGKDQPAHVAGRGFHAVMGDTPLVDVWHWKSVRNNYWGQLDDSHFGSPYPSVPGETRYTAGYKSDPATTGENFTSNWLWFKEGVITPKRLPKDPALLDKFQNKEQADPSLFWGMDWYDTVPYTSELDHYPVGTRMPSVIWKSRSEGDRAHVRANGAWQDGRWTLETRRPLKTDSPAFDVEIKDGVFFWVAPFDHAQIRHGYHLRPVQLKLPEAQP